MGWLFSPTGAITGILLIVVIGLCLSLLAPFSLASRPAYCSLQDEHPEIVRQISDLGEFQGYGFRLEGLKTEYGACMNKDEACVKLSYTLVCERDNCQVTARDILQSAIKVEAWQGTSKLWSEDWFNCWQNSTPRQIKKGETETEWVAFKLDKPEPGGVTITVDGQTVYQD